MAMTDNKEFPVHEMMCDACQEDSAYLENLLKEYIFNMEVAGKSNDRFSELSRELLTYDFYKIKFLQSIVFGGQDKKQVKEIIDKIKRIDLNKDFKGFLENIGIEEDIFFEEQMQKSYDTDKDLCKNTLLMIAKMGHVSERNIRKFVKKVGLDKE